ncbi:hypothetical protein BDK51DRAFT_40604 [Blyttiomyces helicus]|uniref:Uncharacterized protein n=1 Tax=Blyttiomyces helicus TaxID=388810 RepID=A0A4P9W7E3_9FUNG|nr:hypothetical protein BDK51DRAFT_40604 [Blyttiomyces helicus]|eukprot:RKO86690.1 hypothetical protein BDK51DRAFT_40604 [Blyttiomyces helicus]
MQRSRPERNLKEFSYSIRHKSYLERFLGAAPDVTQGTILVHAHVVSSSAHRRNILFNGASPRVGTRTPDTPDAGVHRRGLFRGRRRDRDGVHVCGGRGGAAREKAFWGAEYGEEEYVRSEIFHMIGFVHKTCARTGTGSCREEAFARARMFAVRLETAPFERKRARSQMLNLLERVGVKDAAAHAEAARDLVRDGHFDRKAESIAFAKGGGGVRAWRVEEGNKA